MAGIFGIAIGRRFSGISSLQVKKWTEAWDAADRGFAYHKERHLDDAKRSYQRAIDIYNEIDAQDAATPIYASLGKLLFDFGELDPAERNLNSALALYRRRVDGREGIDTTERILSLISERRQVSDTQVTYVDTKYPFLFVISAGWLNQKLEPQFSRTGGRVAVSHNTHAATLNVSIGPPDRPEFLSKQARAAALRGFLQNMPDRIGDFEIRTSDLVDGETNVVVGEYETVTIVRDRKRRRKDGLVSIIHRDLEYVMQWSAEHNLEQQTRQIISSFRFSDHEGPVR